MAQTDARAGFRLPWSSEPSNDADTGAEAADPVVAEATDSTESAPANSWESADAELPPAPVRAVADTASRKPSKFMADLSKAMQVAAEEARAQTLDQFAADAKAYIEQIHARSTDEAAELRRQADDDVAAVRDWSKAEIARIREEADAKIAARKSRLETEVDEHAAQIEGGIDRIRTRVAAFEGEMTTFFERLLAEDDPTRIAKMAERLPDPPSFDQMSSLATTLPVRATNADEPVPAVASEDAREPGFSAIEAAPTVAEEAEVAQATDMVGESRAADTTQEFDVVADPTGDEVDPRIAAISLADFGAAEVEAAASANAEADTEEIPEIGDGALAARLAGLATTDASDLVPPDTTSTQVIVVGLVSVASIAGFKRQLAGLPGVQSVGVSSGPDGEFLFAVSHTTQVELTSAVPGIPGFEATVTSSGDGTLSVMAHDPDDK